MRLASHLIATLLLLATKALAESADGNYIFCVSDASEPRGFTFRDGIVARSFIKVRGVTATIETPWRERKAYDDWPEKLHWHSNGFGLDGWYHLNRKTLGLELQREGVTVERWECEPLPDADSLTNKLVEVQSRRQLKIDEKMKDNKI